MTAASTRERLIQAARQCLLERGHQACSVKFIAEQAGVNHGLVHHYFGSKERLWLAVMAAEAERLRASLAAAPDSFLQGFFVPELMQRPDRLRLAVEFLGLAKALPEVRQALCEHFRLNRQMVQRRLGLQDEATATLAFGALFGLVIQSGLDAELPVQAAVERMLSMLAGPADSGAARVAHASRLHR